MENYQEYRLCGGIFLTLLLKARKPRTGARKNAAGERDGLSDNELFCSLIKTAIPSFEPPAGRSFATYTSSYKACRLSVNDCLPFNNIELLNKFDIELKTSYSLVLHRMNGFVESFINADGLGNWLVRALLETIKNDPTTADGIFFVKAGKDAYDWSHLLSEQDYCLPEFLIGIWHFILMYRQNNKVGEDTYKLWHKPASTAKGRREFISKVGNQWTDIEVSSRSLYGADTLNDEESIADVYEVPDDKLPIIPPDGTLAPELTGETPWILVDRDLLPGEVNVDDYLANAYEKYSKVKTLIYIDSPLEFYDFYVCNDLSQKINIRKSTYQTKITKNVTIQTLRECSNFILITGTGGLGKSMMMHHLLLNAVKSYDELELLPIFVSLKDYSDEYNTLEEYIFEKFESLGGASEIEELIEFLEAGSCILLFDGFDEITTDYRKSFEHRLELFADKYKQNMFVISSRPILGLGMLQRFTTLELCPFSKAQAIELVKKLKYRPDEPNISKHFLEELETKLFVTHREFTQNPLLLTIMLMTFEQYAEIPSKMHVFYREAYVVLSQKHDANKGAYNRVLKTGLSADQFADFFAEFCARSYRDEKFEFTDVLFDKYFNSLNEKAKSLFPVTASNFRDDLVENMCLMYYEGGKYHFTHRSFQEYFCARYFSKQKDKTLKPIGDFFENKRSRNYTDKTFSMLHDMIPEKVEEYIFEPFLISLFDGCDRADGYWSFLQRMYPVLYYETGETNSISENEPESFLYDSIIHIYGIAASINSDSLPCDERFVTTEWCYLDEEYKDPDYESGELIDHNDVPWDYSREYGNPDVVGKNYELSVEDVLRHREEYRDVIANLDSDEFPIKAEYIKARKLMQQLIDSRQKAGNDLFDLFI